MKETLFKILFLGSPDKEHCDLDARELYEMQHHQNQPIHITATHPHLRHIGHSPSSIICIQPTSASQLPVQIPSPHPHHSTSQQVQASDQMRQQGMSNRSLKWQNAVRGR